MLHTNVQAVPFNASMQDEGSGRVRNSFFLVNGKKLICYSKLKIRANI